MSRNPFVRLLRLRDRQAISDALDAEALAQELHADVCQVTISGSVDREPELIEDHDGEPVWRLVLTRTIDDQQSGHWELQHHHIHVLGALGELYAYSHHTGQRILVTGRLDSPALDTHGTRIGPTWIIATHITILDRDGDG